MLVGVALAALAVLAAAKCVMTRIGLSLALGAPRTVLLSVTRDF